MSRTLTKLRFNKWSSAVTTNNVSINDVKHKNKFIKYNIIINISFTGWLVTGGTSGKAVILRKKRSRKYRIKIFRLRLCFRENRLWIFARYARTLSRLLITDLTVDRCLVESPSFRLYHQLPITLYI